MCRLSFPFGVRVVFAWENYPGAKKTSASIAMGPANSAVERSEDDVMQLDGKAAGDVRRNFRLKSFR